MGPFTTSKLLHCLSFTSFLPFLPSPDTNANSGSQHSCSFKELGGPKTTQSQSQNSDIWLGLAMSHLGSLGKSRNASLLVLWLLGCCKTQPSGPQLAPPLQGFTSKHRPSMLRSSGGKSLANAPWSDVP